MLGKLLIGPALLATGYGAGSYFGRDAEQLVHKSPSVTYAAVEDALAGVQGSGTTSFEGGAPVAYDLRIDRTLDQRLLLDLDFAGRNGAEEELLFTPVNGGKDTLITVRIHADHQVLRSVLAGTKRDMLAYAPNWMLNLTMRPVLQQLAEQIEQGGTAANALSAYTPADAEARWEAKLTPEQRSEVAQWQQYQATQPITDPDSDAQRAIQANQAEQN